MKYNKKIIFIIFVSIFFILGLKVQGNEQPDVELLVKAFNESGGELDTYWLQVGTPFGKYTNDKDLLELGNNLSSSFNLPENDWLTVMAGQNAYLSTGTWENGTRVELQIKKQSEQSNQLYLIFHLEGNQDLNKMVEYYGVLYNILKKNQIHSKINSCIQGNINGKLSSVDQFVLINDILHNLNAKEVEKLDTALVKSVSAYSPEIENYIWTNNNKMNIQIATHVNNLHQKTILTMGTPIIIVEY